MTMVTTMEVEETEALAVDRPRPKVGRIPVTLRLLNESETSEAQEDWQASSVARKSDTQFMLLLVTLFAIVNLTLITLLNHKEKPATAKPAEVTAATAATHAAPASVAVAAQPAPAPVAIPVPPSKMELPVPTASAPLFNAPALPATAMKPPAPPKPTGYVTPASASSTRTTAAPFQPVSVSDHVATPSATALAATAPSAGDPQLTVVHSQPTATPVAAAPELAPAASTPPLPAVARTVSPEAAKQDLLSVINKD